MPDKIDVRVLGLSGSVSARELMSRKFGTSYAVYYDKSTRGLVNQLCDVHGSDKGSLSSGPHPYSWSPHSYADFIERHFGHCRGFMKAIFECGIGTNNPTAKSSMGPSGRPGASLRVWKDYFFNARIVGCDIDRNILFQEDRISTFWCDQTDPRSIAELWRTVDVDSFDIMIDDGLHTFEAGICLFENSFQKLRNNGMYIIEDVQMESMARFMDYFSKGAYRADYVNLYRESIPLWDNSLVVIRK